MYENNINMSIMNWTYIITKLINITSKKKYYRSVVALLHRKIYDNGYEMAIF